MNAIYSRPWRSVYAEDSVGLPAFATGAGLWDDQQTAAAAQIEAALDGVDLVRLVFCDPHGLARSKTLTAGTFRSVLHNGMDFSPGPFIFDTGHAAAVDFLANGSAGVGGGGVGVDEIIGAGDFVVVPDPLTFQVLPQAEPRTAPRTAWVIGDEFLREGTRHPLSTRDVLRRVVAQYTQRRLTPVIGLEVEWYLTRRLPGPPGHAGNGFGEQGAAPLVEAMNSGYQFNLDSFSESLAPVTNPLALMLLELGLPLRTMEHESGPGQLETTFHPLAAMDAADAMLLFRTMVKQTCARRGYHATFMSLPRIDGFDPSGWHIHQSVMDTATGRNEFCAGEAIAGISPMAKSYIEGLLARSSDLCLLSVPTVNGYRRLGPGFALSPTRIRWSTEDRSALIRVTGGGGSVHVENRVGEPSANPYLAMAAQLSAGLEGLADDPGPAPGQPDGAQPVNSPAILPQSLAEALAVFRQGRAAELLGGPLAACLTRLKESEASRFQQWCEREQMLAGQITAGQVTEWEHREYFENY
jgi:glutamine synthetase